MAVTMNKKYSKKIDKNENDQINDNNPNESKLSEQIEIVMERDCGRKEFEKGWFYYCSIGVTRSLPKAFKHFRKAANQGYALAQCGSVANLSIAGRLYKV